MAYQLPLDQMTFADKLQALEMLWADLSKSPEQLDSPEWHQSVLSERRKLVAEGKLRFEDWDQAISDLRSELHEDQDS